eukprot:TRINITY_DN1028_c0_g1_i7.p1 TRINITY_DN1028_c0_g1~~TRINITY_DN1028_c0_g1_i7.p1  ORF type:complete len:643 (-),score=118.01 TRINITY_DN1028_c0_g1_i7:48-1976(-)
MMMSEWRKQWYQRRVRGKTKSIVLLLFLFALLCGLVVVDGQQVCYVRLDQLGYFQEDAKTAVVMCSESSPVPDSLKVFQANTQRPVFSNPINTSLSGWNKEFSYLYGADFTNFNQIGDWNISVFAGSSTLASKTFTIQGGKALYQPLISNALFFYLAQRDGSDTVSSVLSRQPSHLTDANATVYEIPKYKNDVLQGDLVKVGGPVNVEGGYFDAGDFIKFVQTASYVTDVILLAVRDHNNTVGEGFFLEGLRFIEWLSRMWDNKNGILYFQVGIGDGNNKITGDHDLWRLPQHDDTLSVSPGDKKYYIKYRPVFANANLQPNASISPNLAGRLTAAFALCSQVYRTVNQTLAKQCLTYAERIFSLADLKPSKLLTTAPFDYYPETEWRDDMELGAIELFYATQNSTYLTLAANFAENYIHNASSPDTINLYDVSGIAHYELLKVAKLLNNPKIIDDVYSSMLTQINVGLKTSKKDPFNFGDQYNSGDDLTPHAFGYALESHFYAELMNLPSNSDILTFARSQVHWLFGNNAWGTTFVIGAGDEFSCCPQHQVANLAGSLNCSYPDLLGGVGDGPSVTANFNGLGLPDGANKCPANGVDAYKEFTGSGVRYEDNVSAWPSVEPADDYSVLQVLLLARYIDLSV